MQTAWLFQAIGELFRKGRLTSVFIALLAGSLGAQTPVRVKDINPGGSSYLDSMVRLNGRVIFTADDGVHGFEVWVSDGTEAGTKMVKDIWPGSDDSNPSYLTVFKGKVFFTANDGVNGPQLWQTDGTEAGTTAFTSVSLVSMFSRVVFGGELYFMGSDGVHGKQLWKTDGTEAGTKMVKAINESGNSLVRAFAELNGFIYFGGYDGVDNELWRTDGTEAGTTKVLDINPGDSSVPDSLTTVNGHIYFLANDGVHGNELWKTDGTAEGTVMVKDISSGIENSNPTHMAVINGRLFFLAYTTENGYEPWVSDGTEAGTFMLADTDPVSDAAFDPEFTFLKGQILFVGADGQLWRTDGTPEGTSRFVVINPEGSAFPYGLTLLGNSVYFAADDGTHGFELWRSDGTAAGTTLVYDLLPGSGYGDAYPLLRVGGSLFFGATGDAGGNDLYMLEGSGLPDASSLSYSDGRFQITVEGVSGQYLEIDGTEDFNTWSYIDGGFVTDGKLTVTDTAAGDHTHRSYRTRVVTPE